MTRKRLLPRMDFVSVSLGCDPEFFFKNNDGEAIGAEKVIPKDGIKVGNNKIIIDGVQAELNPRPHTCRESLRSEIIQSLRELRTQLSGKNITADFSRTVEISKEKLMELDEQSRKFGCAPSNSIYKKAGIKIESIDPTEYRTRAAGGHIHLGDAYDKGHSGNNRALFEDPKKTVEMLDLICGNTCVLVDRDPSNIERRKVYGRAGEFRTPAHGLEYRTLSNFWMTAYPLMSMAMGLARHAVQLMASPNHEEYYHAFMDKVKAKNVQTAINSNDFDMAMENFQAIQELMFDTIISDYRYGNSSYPIDHLNLPDFMYFVDKIQQNGLKHWFPDDPMANWCDSNIHIGKGFNDYLVTIVRNSKKAEQEAEEKRKKEESRVQVKDGVTIIYADPAATKDKTSGVRKVRVKKAA